ncbi:MULTISPECIES: agmatinase [Inquilinus]|uniref:Agmatinase n=1 Tax=Inquilinus ginsengisoli TaxID=363840 RepID=A0ABU1JGM3_9PROT|nr:agmatinase [Inquilinus ginsengisoli]MDR6287769.1 agmatinase [Inquilinus ginsengisoli]
MAPPYAGIATFLGAPHRRKPEGDRPAVAVLGAPFDFGTTYRPGSRFGPGAIRAVSRVLTGDDHPELGLSPQDRLDLYDAGDAAPITADIAGSLAAIRQATAEQLAAGARVLALGGDHTITLPLLQATAAKHGPVALVQFDAHCDTWSGAPSAPVYHGSHVRLAIERGLIDPRATIQVGLHSPVARDTAAWTRDRGVTGLSAESVHLDGIDRTVDRIRAVVGNRPAYLTFDIDVIDPGMAPGVACPEAGGLFSWQALAILRRLGDLDWVGADVVETCPPYDHSEITAVLAATVGWTWLCLLSAQQAP